MKAIIATILLSICLFTVMHAHKATDNDESITLTEREEVLNASAWAESELWHAATTNNYNGVTSLLEAGVNPNPFHPLKNKFLLQELKESSSLCVKTEEIGPGTFLQNREYCDDCQGHCKEIECATKDIILQIVHELLVRQKNGDPANFAGFLDVSQTRSDDLSDVGQPQSASYQYPSPDNL